MYSELAAVSRTMKILEHLANHPEGQSVTELTDRLDLQKGAVSRILGTLEAEGYVLQDQRTNLFTLTWALVAIALRFADSQPLEEIARPIMTDLAATTGELVQLAVVQGDRLIYVGKVDGVKPLRVASMLGRPSPLHASAAGKVWLASMSDERALELLVRQGLRRVTEWTITEPTKYLDELRLVREQGYATAWQELNRSVVAIAAPVTTAGRGVRASLVVAVPAFEATPERMAELTAACLEAARRMADRLQI